MLCDKKIKSDNQVFWQRQHSELNANKLHVTFGKQANWKVSVFRGRNRCEHAYCTRMYVLFVTYLRNAFWHRAESISTLRNAAGPRLSTDDAQKQNLRQIRAFTSFYYRLCVVESECAPISVQRHDATVVKALSIVEQFRIELIKLNLPTAVFRISNIELSMFRRSSFRNQLKLFIRRKSALASRETAYCTAPKLAQCLKAGVSALCAKLAKTNTNERYAYSFYVGFVWRLRLYSGTLSTSSIYSAVINSS